ncbi:MAG: hypothetical protein AAGJ37_10420 [Pseudomonadota bacterium]
MTTRKLILQDPKENEKFEQTCQRKVDKSLTLIEEQGFLEYTGEYGPEITTFIPFVAWLKQEGYLSGKKIVTYSGMKPYYFFLADSEYEEKAESRKYVPEPERYWPNNQTGTARACRWHRYPDFREHYAKSDLTFDKPVIFIQNKFTVEWDIGPVHFLPIAPLDELLHLTKNRFTIVYSRPRSSYKGYSSDRNHPCEYPDRRFTDRHSHVIDFEKECERQGRNYNQFKLEILARSQIYVGVQGGSSHVLACFKNSVLLLLHQEHGNGQEYPFAYANGPYKYLSDPAPTLLVARNNKDFAEAARCIGRTKVDDTGIHVPFTRKIITKLRM